MIIEAMTLNTLSEKSMFHIAKTLKEEMLLGDLMYRQDCPEQIIEGFLTSQSLYLRAMSKAQAKIRGLTHTKAFAECVAISEKLDLAKSEPMSPQVAEELSSHPYNNVREKLAINPTTPPYILEKLASDMDLSVRIAVAHNESTPQNTLRYLFSLNEEKLFEALLLNDYFPNDLLTSLYEREKLRLNDEGSDRLLIKIANRQKLPPHLIKDMLALAEGLSIIDDNCQLCQTIASNTNVPGEWLSRKWDTCTAIMLGAASNPNTPENILRDIFLYTKHSGYHIKHGLVKTLLVSHENTPSDILAFLLEDDDEKIRKRVISRLQNLL
jgi:hypothetical protein